MAAIPSTTWNVLGLHRFLMLWLGVAVVVLGLMLPPQRYDSMTARYVLGLVSLLGVLASYRVPREQVRLLTLGTGWTAYLWLVYAFSRNGLPPSNAVGLLLLLVMISFPLRTRPELAGTALGVGLTLVYLLVATEDPGVPLPNLALMYLILTLGVGGMGVVRSDLEERLQEANQTLEARVQERTRSLEEEALVRREAERRALSASEAKSVFLANMSHELRTPLNAVLGYTEMVREEAAEIDRTDMVDDLDRVEAAARHLVGLIDAILDLSRVESGTGVLEPHPCGLQQVIGRAVELVPGLNTSQVAFSMDLPDVEVLADEQALVQVLVNLLVNAQKFTERGSITVTAVPAERSVSIHVEDTGIGMSREVQLRVFERFEQGDASGTKVHGGVGLGLAISRGLMERMGGRIEVRSEVGRGSCFTLVLPRAPGLQPSATSTG